MKNGKAAEVELHDLAIRAAAVLPWQTAVLAECREYHQDANLAKHVMAHQVANVFAEAREDARREAVEACVAVFLRRYANAWGGVECVAEMRKVGDMKP